MDAVMPCPNCSGRDLFRSPAVSAGGGQIDFLPGLAGLFRVGKFVLVVCRDCGMTRFFAEPEARAKLKDAKKWKRIPVSS